MPLSKMLEDYRNKKREFPTYDELAAIASHEPCADPIVERNVSLLRQRSTVGVQKYGTTLADNKLPLRAWLNHALEEVLDQANYLQAAMAEIDSAERALPPLPQYFPDVTNIRADEELRAQQYAQDYARSALASAPVQTGHFPQCDQSKPAEQQGVFQKFEVRRTDGSSEPGGKHHDCRYFVLDVDHDVLAKPALQAYAAACAATHPDLSADMVKRFDLTLAQPVAMPDGWKMVPIEPTDAMAVAAIEVTLGNPAINGVAQYRAMIAAAPIAQPEVRQPIMWAALNMDGKAVCVNQDKSACDVERLCIKTPTTIAPLYVGASEPQ